jgi:hypothetical protein
LHKFFRVGWALPTKFSQLQQLIVGNAHPTWTGIGNGKLLEELLVEADELVAIFTTIGKKSK